MKNEEFATAPSFLLEFSRIFPYAQANSSSVNLNSHNKIFILYGGSKFFILHSSFI